MFTPQRKATWTPAASVPKAESRTHLRQTQSVSAKGKEVAVFDAPPVPPPTSLLSGSERVGYDSGNLGDWRRFKEVGLLDESALERKDRQALLDKVSRLEKELFDYQHSMGLLLIEKNNLVSNTEELEQEVSEAQEILKRERIAHLIAVSEAEKREETIKNALIVERKSMDDLERAMRDIHEEHAKAKVISETTVNDINARMEELQKRNLDVEEKSRSIDAKLAELDTKNFELDRKLQDLDVRENILHRQRLSLTQEQESHELYFQKQKEDLLEWERKLQEGEQRLCESRRILNEREEKLLEIDISSKVKESNIEKLQKEIDLANATLKKVEDDVKNQLADLDMKEKKAEAMRCELEARKKELQEEEESLHARESTQLENLLNEHKIMLNAKMHEFESEMKLERTALVEILKSRKEAVGQKEAEINHLEAKLGKREQALEKKSVKVKEKEKDSEVKNKVFKEQEKCLKAEEERLQVKREQISAEKETLHILRKEIEMLRNNATEQELHIKEELKNLEAAEKERTEYLRLQSSLKQEIDSVRRDRELIEKEAADLKLERAKFEKDWEALDEKQTIVNNEIKTLAENKANFEKFQNSEEARLKRFKAENEENLRVESESIILQKESFEASMEHEKLMLAEQVKKEHLLMCQDFERQKQDLYDDLQKRREDWEKLLEEKEKALEEMRLKEMRNVEHLKKDVGTKRREMELERQHLEKEREEMEFNKKQLQETGADIYKDIKDLDNLSKKLKKQREKFVVEKELFGSLIEKINFCKNCGDSAKAFFCSDVQLPNLEGSLYFPRLSHDFPSLSHGNQSNAKDEHGPSGLINNKKPILDEADKDPPQLRGQMSVLRKCASIIFNLSPKKGIQQSDSHAMENSSQSAAHMQAEEHVKEQTSAVEEVHMKVEHFHTGERGSVPEIAKDGIEISQSELREDNVDNSLTVDEFNFVSEGGDISEPQISGVKNGLCKPGRKRGPGVRRTHSVKAVVEDAKAILKDDSVGRQKKQQNDSTVANVNDQENTLYTDMKHATSARKRSRSQASKATESEQDAEYSEGNADSVTMGSQRRRRKTVASGLPTPGQRRYNLRRHAVPVVSSSKPEMEDEITHKDATQAVEKPNETPAQSLNVAVASNKRLRAVEVLGTSSFEFSSDRGHAAANVADNHVDAVKSVENSSFNVKVTKAEDTLPSEIDGISENAEEDTRSMVNENDEGEDDYSDADMDEDEDDDSDDPAQTSVGKKLWKFFTS